MPLPRINPIMTSDTTPSGSCVLTPPFGTAWHAFDGTDTNAAELIGAGFGSAIEYDFGTPVAIEGFRFTTKNDAIYNYPGLCELQYFDGFGWQLAVAANLSGLSAGETTVDQTGPEVTAQRWRLFTTSIVVEGGGADDVYYGELELLGPLEDTPPAGSLELSASAPSETVGPTSDTPDAASFFLSATSPAETIRATVTPESYTIYRVILTGAADGLPDMEVRADNIQIRRRKDSPTFVQVTSADPNQNGDIADRSNGTLIIKQGQFYPSTGTEALDEIAQGLLSRTDLSKGGRRESLVLVGYGAIPTATGKSVTLSAVDFYASGTSGQRARGEIDNQLRPGDTAVVPSEGASFVVDEIVYQIAPGAVTMEAQE